MTTLDSATLEWYCVSPVNDDLPQGARSFVMEITLNRASYKLKYQYKY